MYQVSTSFPKRTLVFSTNGVKPFSTDLGSKTTFDPNSSNLMIALHSMYMKLNIKSYTCLYTNIDIYIHIHMYVYIPTKFGMCGS